MLKRFPARNLTAAGSALLLAALITVPAALAQSGPPRSTKPVVVSGGVNYETLGGVQGYVVSTQPEGLPYTSLHRYDYAESQGPQEVRIMTRIIRTALDEVKAPELPEALKEEEEETADTGVLAYAYAREAYGISRGIPLRAGRNIRFVGERNVTGFYMKGYGYLFNIRWRIGDNTLSVFNLYSEVTVQNTRMQRALADAVRARAARRETTAEERMEEAQYAVEAAAAAAAEEEQQKRDARQQAFEGWQMEYQGKLIEALKEVMAGYGSTLHQVQANEAITFITEFGEEEDDNVTLTIMGRELAGPGAEARSRVKNAIRVSRGGEGASETLKTQMRIMSEIIDAAFEEPAEDTGIGFNAFTLRSRGNYQYIAGYGVILRKSARELFRSQYLVFDRAAAPPPPDPERLVIALEQRMEELPEQYAEQLETLKQKTAEVLTTYGATLTELKAGEWVGIHYDVGGAVQLLQGGPDYFLVQAKMSDIREAAAKGDAGTDWLLARLITNEREEEQ